MRAGVPLISLAGVLLAVILGAVPVSASSVASGEHDTPAFAVQPGQPTVLTATAVSSSEVELSWTAPPETTPATTPPETTPATTPPETTPATTPPETTPATTPAATTPPAVSAPGSVHGGVLLAGRYVRGASAEGYDVYEGTRSGGESQVAGPVTGTTFKVTGLDPATTYFFEVTAVDAAGQSGRSNEASAKTFGGSPGIPAPLLGVPGVLAVIGAATVGVLVWRRRSPRPPSGPPPVPPVIKAVPDAGPPPAISVHATGTGATHTVRIESHSGPGITTIEEVRPR